MPVRVGGKIEILKCPPGALTEALGVLYSRAPAGVRPQLVAEMQAEAERGAVDLSRLWIARQRGGRIIGVLPAQKVAGRIGVVGAPEVITCWSRAGLAAALVRMAMDGLRGDGVRLIQALVDEVASRRGSLDLIRGGLPRVTELIYLSRDVSEPIAVSPTAPRIAWEGFGPHNEAEFRQALEGTYLGSLDMPELKGVRTLEDLMAAHSAGCRFQPDLWRLGRIAGEPEGAVILLLNEPPDRPCWELGYLGLTPSVRGRGLGRAALEHALERARPHTGRIELAVDVRNHPARGLYRATGFVPFERRAVHLTVLPTG